MKWYPLAHLAAVTMSCFYAEPQAMQMLCPTSATGIARSFSSFLLYMHIFQRVTASAMFFSFCGDVIDLTR